MAASNLSLHTQNSSQLDKSLEVAIPGPGIEYFVLASALGFIMLLAIFGNGILIFTMCRTPSLRTRTNMFILNLACADLGVALMCMPFSIITCFARDWIFGDSLCHLNGFLNILFECSSLFTLTAISIEKYFSIVKPMAGVITTRLACIMVAMTWITALILASMPLTGFITFDFKAGLTQCSVQVPITLGQSIYAVVVLVVAYLIPLCIMGFCYVNIFRAAKRHNIRLSRISLTSTDTEKLVSSQSQVAVTIFIMFIAFFLCWTPYFTYMVYMTARQVKSPDVFTRSFGLASYWCAFLNSCIDPFVYGVRNPDIRKELRAKCCQRCQDMQKAQSNSENDDSRLKPPQLYTDCDKTTPVYLAYTNFVALTEEDIVSPNEGISKQTTDRSSQTGHVLELLSMQDLCKVDFTTELDCGRNQTLPRGFTTLPLLFQDNADSTKHITCSTCSNACTEDDHVTNSEAKMLQCFNDSSEGSLCSDGESNDSVSSMSRCSCEDGSCSSCDDPACSSKSCFINTFPLDFSNQLHSKNTKRVSFLSTNERAKKFKIGWIESQL